tara:strand:- start:722 stop:904 length:183 start_codon:yes stop_codon:yes gene_type:complete
MLKYYWLSIAQTQAFDVIIAVSCIIPFYFLMKRFIRQSLEELREDIKNDVSEELYGDDEL